MMKINNVFKNKFNKKNIIILIIVVLLLLLTIFSVIYFKRDKTLKFNKVFDLEDFRKIEFIEKGNYVIASKYKIGSSKVYESVYDVKMGNSSGKMIYIRGKEMNANIYRSKFLNGNYIEELPIIVQIDQYMKSFTNEAFHELNISSDEKAIEEKLYGETIYKFPIPIEESIYKYNRLYSKSYKIENINYDFNYYMNDGVFICEIVKFI